MSDRRPNAWRGPARIMATGGVVCLTLAAGFASALDPGEGTRISKPKPRAPLELGTERKVPLPPVYKGEPGELGEPGEKAEVAIFQDLAMHFGTLCDNDGYVVLGTADTIVQDPNHLVYGGSPQSAQIRLTGDANRAVGVTVAAGSATGFTLSNFNSDKGVLPLSNLSLDASGSLTLHLGARLQVIASSVNPGSDQQIGYTISATYE
jgi:hypothetical protein